MVGCMHSTRLGCVVSVSDRVSVMVNDRVSTLVLSSGELNVHLIGLSRHHGRVHGAVHTAGCAMISNYAFAIGPLSVLSVMLVYCGKTVGWIKMKLVVASTQAHIVLDGDSAPPPSPKRAQPLPNFRPMSIVAKRLHGSRCHLVRG